MNQLKDYKISDTEHLEIMKKGSEKIRENILKMKLQEDSQK